MANNLNYTVALRNAMLDEITTAIGSNGKLKIYGDTQPTNADTALSGQTLLATLALSATAAAGASSGVLTFSSISNDASADGSGTATWGTVTQSDDDRVFDFTVGTSGADLNMDSVSITAGQTVAVTSFTITGGNV